MNLLDELLMESDSHRTTTAALLTLFIFTPFIYFHAVISSRMFSSQHPISRQLGIYLVNKEPDTQTESQSSILSQIKKRM